MGFSNKKEDVIYMELTPYGRQLLSRGQLKPAYYSFYDDDILYDIASVPTSDTSNYPSGFLSESNGSTKERILTSTPYLQPSISYTGREKKLTSIQNYYLYEDMYKFENYEKISFLNYPIGTSDYHSMEKAPYWDIKYLHGTASSTETSPGVFKLNTTKNLDTTGPLSSSLPFKNIPQIHFDVDYEISIKNIYTDDDSLDQLNFTSPNLQMTDPAPDGTYVSLKEQPLMFHILEKNAFKSSDSFNIEVYKYETTTSNSLVPLKFSNIGYLEKEATVINDMLVDVEDESLYEEDLTPDNTYVEYYFDLRVDGEIPEEDICSGLQLLKVQEIFLDIDVDCLKRDDLDMGALDVDFYATQVTEIEEC